MTRVDADGFALPFLVVRTDTAPLSGAWQGESTMSLLRRSQGSLMDRDNPAYRGQSEYTPLFLKIYDP